jgi:linoleoyl-CoA desaturase
VGYSLLRVTRDDEWVPGHVAQPLAYALLATLFEYGIAFYDVDVFGIALGRTTKQSAREKLKETGRKIRRQVVKDYVLFPALTGPAFVSTLTANVAANLIRNVWTNAVIFCGHFPDGAEKFTMDEFENETKAEWYLRQMLGSANFRGGKLMTFMTGALNYQIEHHLFPDLPSNRYPQIAERVQEICERYGIPYTTGPFLVQYAKTVRTILKLSLPNRFLKATSDDAPETASERKWQLRDAEAERELVAVG